MSLFLNGKRITTVSFSFKMAKADVILHHYFPLLCDYNYPYIIGMIKLSLFFQGGGGGGGGREREI